MDKTELKYNVIRTGSHHFDHKTMKFFGDTMANYGVRAGVVDTWTDGKKEVWELYRRHPVRHGLNSSAYFDKITFEGVHPKK